MYGGVEWLVDHRAQAVDVHAQRIRIRQLLAPHAGFEFLARDHRGRRLHQRLQDLQAGRIELQQLAIATHFERVEVVLEVGDGQHPGLHAAAAPRQRIQAHLDFLQRERLDQVVVGAGVEAGELVVERIARGQHQHRRLLARLVAQLAADLEAIHARQVEVEHDRVEVMDHGQVQPGHAVGGEVDGVAAILEVVAEVGGDVLVVFDDEDAHPVLLNGGSVWTGRLDARADRAQVRPDDCNGVPQRGSAGATPAPSRGFCQSARRRRHDGSDERARQCRAKQRPRHGSTMPGPNKTPITVICFVRFGSPCA